MKRDSAIPVEENGKFNEIKTGQTVKLQSASDKYPGIIEKTEI